MQWNIVSFGDVTVLLTVFNAIASIAADGSYKAAAAAIALFVFAGAMMLSLSDGKQEIPVHRVFVGFMLYTMGFTTLQTVTLENRYDGTVAVVDNIPVAIAVPASLISNVGLKLATLTETAFGNVNAQERISDTGYLSPMRVIAKYYSATQNSCPAGMVNSNVAGYRFCQSIYTFMNECVLPTAKRDGLTAVLKNQNIVSALDVKSKSFGTRLTKADGSSEYPNCQEASEKVKLMLTSGDFEKMVNSLGKQFQTRDGETAITQSQDVLSMIGVDAGKARNLMSTIMVSKLVEDAEISFYHSIGASHYAENILSSIEQRNYAWTAQGELWTQIVNKFITIMECLLYAMTPIIGLMVLCGALGKKTLLLYLQMLGAIQMIPMLLVVAQNIIMTQFAREMLAIEIQHEVGSIVYTQKMFEAAKELMGLGGMIAATIVPAMAMALITGSGMAVMGAMKSAAEPAKDTDAVGNHTDQGGAIRDMSNLNKGNVNAYGDSWTKSGSELVGKISREVGNSVDVSAAQTKAQQASQNYTSALNNSFQTGTGKQHDVSSLFNWGRSAASGTTQQADLVNSVAQQMAQKHSLTEAEQSTLSAMLMIGGKLGFGTVGVGGEIRQSVAQTSTAATQKAYDDIISTHGSEQLNAQFQEAIKIDRQNNNNISTSDSEMDNKMKSVQEARVESEMATQQWQEAKKASDTAKFISQNTEMAVHQISQDENMMNNLNDAIRANQDDESWMRIFSAREDEFNGDVNGMDLSDNSAKVAAFLAANNETGNIASNQEFLSLYNGHQPQSSDDLKYSNNLNGPDNGIPTYGELPRAKLEEPEKGKIPDKSRLDDLEKANRDVVDAKYQKQSGWVRENNSQNKNQEKENFHDQVEPFQDLSAFAKAIGNEAIKLTTPAAEFGKEVVNETKNLYTLGSEFIFDGNESVRGELISNIQHTQAIGQEALSELKPTEVTKQYSKALENLNKVIDDDVPQSEKSAALIDYGKATQAMHNQYNAQQMPTVDAKEVKFSADTTN
ncbi:conjugal transfer protein TraG N-terminal domain-containing protein [Vibrio cholerae]